MNVVRKNIFRIFLLSPVIFAFFISGIGSILCSQESKLVSAILENSGDNYQTLLEAIREHEVLLKKYSDSNFAPTVMFQLAELHAHKSELDFERAMAKYEEDLKKFDDGELQTEPVMPRISFENTIQLLYKILMANPRVDFKDRVLYLLAKSHLEEGNRERARQFFSEIIESFPNSQIAIESYFRLGEYYFDKRNFKNAVDHYKHLLNQWDSPFFDMALYKLGWSYYNLNRYVDAISTFIFLIDDIDLVTETDSKTMGKSKAELRSESIDYIASCFTEYGGPRQAKEFLESRKDKDYALTTLLRMGELYQKRDYYPEAVETYEILLQLYPFYEDAPNLYTLIVQNYEAEDKIEEANRIREEIVKKFGPSGPWEMFYPEGEIHTKALTMAEQTLLDLGTYYQAQAQKKGRAREYRMAIDKYEEFLEKFANANNASKVNYYLAECLYESGDYVAAAYAYNDVVVKYDSSEYKQEAAYNRILCYYRLCGTEEIPDSLTIYIDEFLGSGDIIAVKVADRFENELLQACNDFTRFLPESKWYDQVLMKYGETLYKLKSYIPAAQVYQKVVELGPQNSYHLQAALNLAQCYYDAGKFDDAESWFRNVAENFPDSTKYVEKAQKMAASTQFKIAAQTSANGDAKSAAQQYYKISQTAADSLIRIRALFDAAGQYQNANDLSKSALTYEELAQQYPTAELADEALYKAAGLREMLEQWEVAAADYIKLVDSNSKSEFAPRALKNAAVCYENKKDWYAAERIYRRYASSFTEDVDELLEVLYKIGEMSYNLGDMDLAIQGFQETVDTHKKFRAQNAFVDDYIPAKAQFMIGEVEFDEYKKIEISPPFAKNLQKKKQKFQQVFKEYKDALQYQVADWSTAASYKIGMAFEEFGRALIESPRPDGLEGDQVKQYENTLAEYALPYKQKALETYTKNVIQAETNKVENLWVDESRKRMQSLTIELGLKSSTSDANLKSHIGNHGESD